MRIGIDLTALLPETTGVDVYLTQLVRHLARADRENDYVLFLNTADRARIATAPPPTFQARAMCFRPRPVRLAFQQLLLPAAATLLRLDVLHSPAFIMPLVRGRPRHVVTVYDMTFFSLPSYHIALRRSAPYRWAVLHSIRRADLVCVPSRWVYDDVKRLVPELAVERIRVVPPGIADSFRPRRTAEAREVAARLGLPTVYILYVGTIEPRKNVAGLVRSYRELIRRRDVVEHLVLVGRLGWSYDDLLSLLGAPDLRNRVHLAGYLSDADLASVYAGARLLVYPSWSEGFGFPPLEAMACGVPTIASRSSALTENLDGAAELVPPGDEEALCEAMARLLTDTRLRAHRIELGLARAAQFRWDETARQMRACYESLAPRG